jgi:predicted AAA+ superfamily ATPase
MYERHAARTVLEALEWSPVVLIEGPRQAGKSVLARDIVGASRSAAYVTFDDALRLASAHADPQDFVGNLPDPVVLDEVQRAPEIFRAIKLSVDQDRRSGRFLLTGSANVLLLPRLSDSLAGRMRIVTLWPLSQGEIGGVSERFIDTVFGSSPPPLAEGVETRRTLAARITRGGFPEAVRLPEGPVRDGWMRDYVSTLLGRDVQEITRVGDRVGLPRLLRLLAARSATLLNASDLSRGTGISRGTIDRYIALFATTFAMRLVPAWAANARRPLRSRVEGDDVAFTSTPTSRPRASSSTQSTSPPAPSR